MIISNSRKINHQFNSDKVMRLPYGNTVVAQCRSQVLHRQCVFAILDSLRIRLGPVAWCWRIASACLAMLQRIVGNVRYEFLGGNRYESNTVIWKTHSFYRKQTKANRRESSALTCADQMLQIRRNSNSMRWPHLEPSEYNLPAASGNHSGFDLVNVRRPPHYFRSMALLLDCCYSLRLYC